MQPAVKLTHSCNYTICSTSKAKNPLHIHTINPRVGEHLSTEAFTNTKGIRIVITFVALYYSIVTQKLDDKVTLFH